MKSPSRRPEDPAALIPIRENPAYGALLGEISAHEKRLAEARRRKEQAEARRRGVKSRRNVADLAKQLVAGATVCGSDPEQQIHDAEAEIAILWPALGELTQRLDELHGDLSLATCRVVKAEHDQALRDALAAIRGLRDALERAAAVRARVRALGYAALDAILPAIAPFGAVQLGDPDAVGASNAWLFKNELQKRGII
ncbi:MAG TPA: hypothetical protein VE993_22105 [Stellaceae bacterium]|nr:hypothetical protein [Stellaceae bacterium]